MTSLVDLFFGCWHKHFSFPITVRQGRRKQGAAAVTGTYIVCLDCGKEFAYDWEEMKVVEAAGEDAGMVKAAASYAGK